MDSDITLQNEFAKPDFDIDSISNAILAGVPGHQLWQDALEVCFYGPFFRVCGLRFLGLGLMVDFQKCPSPKCRDHPYVTLVVSGPSPKGP